MIEHRGIIAKVSGNRLSVKILQQSACSACHAKGVCMAADSKEKIVEVTDFTGRYKVDDPVIVEGKESMGYKAVLWAFVIPLVILVVMLILTVWVWNFSEVEAAVVSILALAPYYWLLYLLRNKMAGSFTFNIKNTN